MAYNAIAQADLDVASNASDSDASRSPSPKASPQHHGFEKVPLDVDNLGGNGSNLEPAKAADDMSVGHLVSMIRSMSSTSYDMVEDDDYETVEPKSNSPRRGPPPIDTTTAIKKSVDDKQPQSASSVPPPEEPPLRTPVSDHTVPLSHPTPGLQSLQGAYLGNIERLERSAERMSAGSADIASEIRKMDLELKRRCSSSSVANSVVASNHDPHISSGVSPTGNKPSPRSSIRSATRLPSSRLAQVSEGAPVAAQPPPASRYYGQRFYSARGVNPEIERPSSAATNDTYQQAKALFSDFDGVHYVPQDSAQGRERQASLTKPPLAKQSNSYRADSMVYYPAPVPTALNLPPRLSDKPPQAQEKRRSHRLSAALFGHRRSALGPSGRPATSREIEVSQTSPVATLDRILDDSTRAPVTTSAERPCTSAEAYGISHQETSSQNLEKQKKKRSSRSLFRFYKKTSSSNLSDPPATGHPPQPTEAEAADTHEGTTLKSDVADGQEGDGEVLDHSQEDIRDYTGPPDSLMAELELRKHELKHRSRTAADPQGLRSTLLQLDAVAQKQSERRQRPVSMAWDHSNAVYDDSEGDEDVPLGILYPEKPDIPVETRPLDLMEKRQMEENEPLSKRRTRLRGEQPTDQHPNLSSRPSTMYLPGSHGPAESDSENEGETLAQRIKRLRAKNRNSRNSTTGGSDFTSEVLAEFNHIKGNDGKEGETASQDETLAETRARLRQDSKPQHSRYAKVPRSRRSMGSISLMRPKTAGRQSSHETALDHNPVHSQHAYHDPRMSMHQSTEGYQHPQYARYPVPANSYGYGMVRPNTIYSDAALGINHTSYAMSGYPNMGTSMAGVGQQERINHWRQSVI